MAQNVDPREQLVALLPRLRRFAGALVRDAADADDLVQVTVERALARLHQWRRDARLDAWTLGIMKNAWIDELRRRRRHERVHAPEEAGENVCATDEKVEMRMRAMAIERGMARLPDEQRLAIALVLVDGLSYRDAAGVMGVPLGTLTSRLARGRATLEAFIAAPPSGEGGALP
jgi:RNA polymerase sigma-70 factor (ECF subfamily)